MIRYRFLDAVDVVVLREMFELEVDFVACADPSMIDESMLLRTESAFKSMLDVFVTETIVLCLLC